jgi:PAS domain S-box-containing protein
MDISNEIEELKKLLPSQPVNDDCSPAISLSIFEIDRDGNFTMVPEMIETITGFEKEELSLLSLQNVVFVEDRARVIKAIDSVMNGSRIVISEIEIFSDRTGSHPVELIMLPKSSDGEITGAWGAVKDIQSRKEMEEKLEATREIHESSRLFLQDFVSLMAREIRQPMTTTLLNLEMLDSGFYGDLNDKQRERIKLAISDMGRMKSILHQAISSSKDLGEEIKLDRRMISLSSLISEVLKEKEKQIEFKNLEVTTDFPEGDLHAPVDRKMILQVVSSLIENSIGMSPEKGHIGIELKKVNENVQFSIADTGEGIEEKEVDGIFDKFHGDQDNKEGPFREGLNLYMAKRIVETHGGRIWCESFPSLGSTFLFTIPLDNRTCRDRT